MGTLRFLSFLSSALLYVCVHSVCDKSVFRGEACLVSGFTVACVVSCRGNSLKCEISAFAYVITHFAGPVTMERACWCGVGGQHGWCVDTGGVGNVNSQLHLLCRHTYSGRV